MEDKLADVDYHIEEKDIKQDPSKVYLQLEKYIRFLLYKWEIVLKERSGKILNSLHVHETAL